MPRRTTLSLLFLFYAVVALAQYNLYNVLDENTNFLITRQSPRAGKLVEVKVVSKLHPWDERGKRISKYNHEAHIYECCFLNDTVITCKEKGTRMFLFGIIPLYHDEKDDAVFDHYIIRNNSIITVLDAYEEQHAQKFIHKDSVGYHVEYNWKCVKSKDSAKSDSIFLAYLVTRKDNQNRVTYYYLHEPEESNLRIKKSIEYFGDTLEVTNETDWNEQGAPEKEVYKELTRWNKDSTEEKIRDIDIELNNDTLNGRNVDTIDHTMNYRYDKRGRVVHQTKTTLFLSDPDWIDKFEIWVKYKKD